MGVNTRHSNKMDNRTTVYKHFQIEVENWSQDIYPVHSTVISVDIGEDAPSLWGVMVDGEEDKLVEVSLFRLDTLAVGVNVTITLEISHQGVEYKVTDNIETGEENLERDDPCCVTTTVLDTKYDPHSHLTLSISGLLEISYLTPHRKCQEPGTRSLTFGPVQELHYLQKHPKITFQEKIIKYSHSIFKDFTRNLEKENSLDRFIYSHI